MATDEEQNSNDRLVKVDLDDAGMPRRSAEAEQERAIAIYDLLEENIFKLDEQPGPYHLCLRLEGRHVHFDIREVSDNSLIQFFMQNRLERIGWTGPESAPTGTYCHGTSGDMDRTGPDRTGMAR